MMKKILKRIKEQLQAYWRKLSYVGLVFAAIFFVLSLTPSLLPRISVLQGALSGLTFVVGYGVGCFFYWLWRYLQIPQVPADKQRNVKHVLGILLVFVVMFTLGRYTVWQNSTLELMSQPLISDADPLLIAVIATILAVFFIWIGRLIKSGFAWVMKKIYKFVPRRAGNVAGFLLALLLFVFLFNGVLLKAVFNFVDDVYAEANNIFDDWTVQPQDSFKTGSADSLVSWESLGKAGRRFVSSGPSAQEIEEFTGQSAQEPVRVYVGLNSADTVEQRAKLALDELKRQGGFEKKILVVVTPTGTGWMDPYAMDTLEYLHGGNTAVVAVQYSYLQSPIAMVVAPDKPRLTADVMFHEIYNHWTILSKEDRPELFLHGVSLGSFGSEHSFRLHEVMDDPIAGALWAGPPFTNTLSNEITEMRNPGSSSWLPEYQDGSFVRFTAQRNEQADVPGEWGEMRLLYLQYASDPIVFFKPSLLYKSPEWLEGGRGPEISPMLHWYPGVTFFQVLFDLMVSKSAAPVGFGHDFSPIDYIDNWISLTDPQGWDEAKVNELKEFFWERVPEDER